VCWGYFCHFIHTQRIKRYHIVRYNHYMITLFLVVAIVVINIVLGTGILLNNSRSKTNRLYALFVAFISIWIISNYLENEPGFVGEESLDFFLRLDFTVAMLFHYLWFRFSSVFVESKLELPSYKWLRALIFSITLFLALASFLGSILITDVVFADNVIQFGIGQIWTFYVILINIFMVSGLLILYLGRRRAKLEQNLLKKRQINLIFFGSALSITISMIINLPQAVYPISLEVSRLGIYGMIFLVVFTAYAMARTRFFEMRILIIRAVSFLLLIVAIAVAYTFLLFVIATSVFQTSIDTRILIGAIVVAVVIATTFDYIRRWAEQLTNRLFFKKRYVSAQLISELTHIMAETIDLNVMTKQILKKLTEEMKITKAAFLLVDNSTVTNMRGIGFKYREHDYLKLQTLFDKELSHTQPFLFEELEEGPLKTLFRKLDISLAMPLRVENNEIAILILGSKASGEMYYQRDIDVLIIFAAEAGIAIQNAKAFEAIKQFSEKLEKRVEERTRELKQSQKRELAKAEEVLKLKDEFVFLAAHELRTPVTAIRGFLELVSEAEKDFPKDVQEHLSAISSASGHLAQLITDLLEIARSEAGTLKVEVKPMNIMTIIDATIKELDSLIQKKHIGVSVKDGNIPDVLGDEQRTKEVVTNILSNAIKYNKEGGQIAIRVFEQGGKVIVEVRDTGYGIPKDQQDKIFSKFFRAQSKKTRTVIGTGLGLFITRLLVEKMGGKISLTSFEGEGTTVAFSLRISN